MSTLKNHTNPKWLPYRLAGWLMASLCTLSLSAAVDNLSLNGFPVHPTKILASFKAGNSPSTAAGQLTQAGSSVVQTFQILPSLVVLDDVDPAPSATAADALARLNQRIANLKNSGLFEYVEPDYLNQLLRSPTDPALLTGTLWGLNNTGRFGGNPSADISATNAWDITTGSTNVIVGVVDTGIRYTHQDLATNMWRNPGEIPGNNIDDDGNGYVDDVFGINAIALNGNPMDGNGHGTHVAGTIGAAANNGPAAPSVGVCWTVKLMALKIFDDDGSFAGTSRVITCLDYAIKNGAKVLNNSWGGGGYSQALYDAINRCRAAGVLFVAAAGNNGYNNDVFPFYPSGYDLDNVIAVAATDRNDAMADFSQFGLTSVDLGAPGVQIFSSWSDSDVAYNTIDGTSMASPHVAGVAALILSQFPTADLGEIRGRLLEGVDVLPTLSGLVASGGRLNAYKALTLAGSGVIKMRITPPSGSAVLASTAQPVFVEVSDPPLSLLGATVTAVVPGVGNITFLNDGVPPDAIAGDRIYSANLNVPASTNTLTMTVTASATNRVDATATVTYYVVTPPVNDHFTNSIKVPAGGATYLSNNRFATRESGEPVHAGVLNNAASLWWAYTADTTTNVFVDSAGSFVDTILAVYSGNSVTNLTRVATNNDVGPIRQAYLSFPAVAGSTYRIALASAGTNQVGSVQLRVTPGGGPDVTLPQVFIAAPLNGSVVTTNVVNITGTASDPSPNSSGVREVILSVNSGFGIPANGTTNWSLNVTLKPGINIIQAQALDASGNLSPSALIQINYVIPGPANDFFANAGTLPSPTGKATVNTTSATAEVGEHTHAGIHATKSVWWNFTAPQDGQLILTTTGSSFDTVLALYTGSSVGNLTPVASNDDDPSVSGGASVIRQAVRAGQTYRIALDGYDGLSGTAVISNYFSAATVFQVTANSSAGGSAVPVVSEVVSNGTVTLMAVPNQNYVFDSWSGDQSALTSTLTVTVRSNMTLTASFRPVVFTDGFESGDLGHLAWVTGGNEPWVVRTNVVSAGQFAARSGFISHNQTSSLLYSGNFQSGSVTFDYKVSSEASFDWLRFLVDGVVNGQWSGEAGWANYSAALTPGNHTLEWRYDKDSTLNAGMDAAFIDNLNLPLVVTNNTFFKARLTLRRLADGTAFVDLMGQPGQTYVFEASENMINWESFSTNIATGGFARAVDAASTTKPRHYYRAFIPVQN